MRAMIRLSVCVALGMAYTCGYQKPAPPHAEVARIAQTAPVPAPRA